MDGLRLPPLIEEVLDPSDELQEHKFLLMTEGLSEKPSEEEAYEEKRQQDEEEKGAVLDSKEELKELRDQLVQLLLKLEETREVSQQQEQSCEELQGLLEDERLASAHQAESFTRQIQTLQVQLHSVQQEAIRLQEERDGELKEVQQELRWAQEEVLLLQQAAEEAAVDSENDIAYLQEELCRLKAELQSLHAAVAEYELEINALRAELNTESLNPPSAEVAQLQVEAWSLSCERQTLSGENRRLSDSVERLQCDDVYPAIKRKCTPEPDPKVKAELGPLVQSGPEPLDSEISVLKVQLQCAEETAQKVQEECDAVKAELVELQLRYDCSQQERTSLALELQRCKAELQRLLLRSPQNCTPQSEPPLLSAPIIGLIVIMALIWCWWEELSP
ncbi:coiled-coil domain-containing protein 136 [Oryzias melastigma]|uniref:coiled-coil domain-containing protein 136 n=1 Tax=Oryzias melastigma TaxID=30732 RepID=UPI000CF8187A|nr:coiled-coil domain-containing protein 136 [Oryzias melastigma]